MSSNPFLYFSRKPILAGLFMFSLLLLLTQYLSYERYLLLKATELRELNNEAAAAKERLQTALSYSLSTTQTLGFIVEKYGLPRDFDSVGAALMRSNRFIDAVQLVEGGVITHVYPLKGNEVVIGFDILKDTARNSGALHAIETKKFFWAGPFELKQGGVGIVGRQPLYKNGKFRGFSAVVIRLPTFLNTVGIDSNSNDGFTYQLSRLSRDRKQEIPFFSNQNFQKNVQSVSIDVPDVEWKLYVSKKSKSTLFFAITFSFLGLVLSITGGLLSWFMARQPALLNKLVEEKAAALSASENNLLSTLERVSDAFVAIDTNFCYTYMNKRAGEIFHRNPQAIVGKNMWEEFPDWVDKPFYHVFKDAMKNQQYVLLEEYYEKQSLWFESKIYPSPNGLSVFIQDITERKKAELAILVEKNLSDSIINSLPGAFYLYDETGKFLRWNKNFETVSGYSTEEVSNMHPLDFFATDEKEKLRKKIEDVFAKGMADVEAHLFTKAKQKIPYYFNGHLATFGGKDYLIGMGIDITDRNKAEQEIVVEKNLSDSIVNSLPGIFYLADLNGRLLRWNKNFETVSGYTSDEVSKMRIREFVAPDDQENIFIKKELTIQTGMSDVEAGFLTKQKQKLPYHFTTVSSKYKDQPCLLGVGIDITERKKAQWAVIESEEKYRSLIESSPDIIMRLDLEEKVRFINYTAGGFTPEDIIGSSAYNFVMPEFHDLVRETHHRAIHTQQPQTYETCALGLDGIKRWFFTSVGPIILNGKVTGITLLTRDITERVKAEDALLKSTNELKERVKELNCLYRISEISNSRELSTIEILQQCVHIIPPSYQYPEITCARISFDGEIFLTEKFKETIWKQEAEILIQEKCVGKIEVFYMEEKPAEQEGPFLKEERWLIDSMAKVISTAIERKKAEQEIVLANTALRDLSSHLQTVREEERTAISRELHDELGQQLTALKMDIVWLGKKINSDDALLKEKITESSALVDDTVKTIRRINTDLRPGIIDDLGLFAALDWQAKEFSKRTGIICVVDICENEPVLDKNITINIFRIFQEALTNIARHANATEVNAELKVENQKLFLIIQDNGIGFDAEEVKQKKSFGLLGIRERAIAINAAIEIVTQKGNGTIIKLTLPIII